MIEQINIDTFELVSNNILIKVDPDMDFVEIPGPNGTKVSLKIVDDTTPNNTKNISITGTVLKTPERLKFHVELKTHERGRTISNDEFSSLMRDTMPHDVDLNVIPGDQVIFDYKQGLEAETEGRLLKDEKHGYVMLLKYDTLFAKVVGPDLVPLNGWVFFIRDQQENEELRESGILVVHKIDKYESNFGTVVVADAPVRMYTDNRLHDGNVELPEGMRILIQRKFGSRIAHDVNAGKFLGIECVKRKNILCTFE